MIVQKTFLPWPTPKITSFFDKNTPSILEGLNEIKKENVLFLTTNSHGGSVINHIVFYEDENVLTCPDCGHDLSTTFSFCPNCGRKLK